MFSVGLNQIAMPSCDVLVFCKLASAVGCKGVEFRNDVGQAHLTQDVALHIKQITQQHNLRIFTLSEIGRFDDWNDERQKQSQDLINFAHAMGAEAISLIPRNDGAELDKATRIKNLKVSLNALQPMLADKSLLGLIEPLGFKTASLRFKSEIVEAITELDYEASFKIVHDTFHHALSGENEVYAQHTGLVHISGVEQANLEFSDMQDQDRVLVGSADRLGNIDQIQKLQDAGYLGPVSFEPFSPMVQNSNDLEGDLARSISFINANLQKCAA